MRCNLRLCVFGPRNVCKVWFKSFKKFGPSVNKATMEQRRNGSDREFWAVFGETLNICGELTRKFIELWVVGTGCKINL